jgi:toxin ParE1/3/4
VKVRFLKSARLELRQAFEYYRSVRPELGTDFLAKIRDHPLAWQEAPHGTRRYLLNRFPYGIVYKKYDDTVLIIAVANLHQMPEYWQDRV